MLLSRHFNVIKIYGLSYNYYNYKTKTKFKMFVFNLKQTVALLVCDSCFFDFLSNKEVC